MKTAASRPPFPFATMLPHLAAWGRTLCAMLFAESHRSIAHKVRSYSQMQSQEG
jgi:hypothetical protein